MRGPEIGRLRAMHVAILQGAALLVPAEGRAEWLAEWKSELWYASQECNWESASGSRPRAGLTAFCLGSVKDALWLRLNGPRSGERGPLCLESPMQCMGFLGALAGFTAGIMLLFIRAARVLVSSVDLDKSAVIFISTCFLIPAVTSRSVGEFLARRELLSWLLRPRLWLFLSFKIGFILLIVCCAIDIWACDSSPLIMAAAPLVVQIVLWSCLFALRWAFVDQRQRCPVCLRLLTKPVWVGDRSRYFLEWNCTELMCPRGHGLLYVPELPASWFSAQRWVYLNPSWSSLFRRA
jgi:hypothetical protein